MWVTPVKHGSSHRVLWSRVREDTRRQITQHSVNVILMCHLEKVGIHKNVILEHINRLFEIFEHTTHICREMNHTIERHVFLKQLFNLCNVTEIRILCTHWNPFRSLDGAQGTTYETRCACHEYPH